MDSYIVRIYRQTGDPAELAGQIEKAGTEIKENFHSSGELVEVLTRECEIQGETKTDIDITKKIQM